MDRKIGNNPFNAVDHGAEPYIFNIDKDTMKNTNFRTAIWTGSYLQITLMSLKVGESIGVEMHTDVDQFIRVEDGYALVEMGNSKDRLYYKMSIDDDYAAVIPAGTWHNITNTGRAPLKLYSIYAPPEHNFGTVHKTKEEAEEEHH